MIINISKNTDERFYMLDGLRGVAAILVMFYHYGLYKGMHWIVGAWVSVDLFFILSGYVIAHRYREKIVSGLGIFEFSKIRLIRLWPLYFLGLLIGLLDAAMTPSNLQTVGKNNMELAAVFSAFFVPYLNSNTWPMGAGGG